MDHLLSKAAILSWICAAYPDEIVDADLDSKNITTLAGTTERALRPDAWVHLKAGPQIAVEFQHSAGDGERILEKTRQYASEGITAWWIFSKNSSVTCKDLRDADWSTRFVHEIATLSTTQQSLVRDEIPFFWFDQTTSFISTPHVKTRYPFKPRANELWEGANSITADTYSRAPIAGVSTWTFLYEHVLEDCSIDLETGKLITRGTKLLECQQQQIRKDVEKLRRQARERKSTADAREETRKRREEERARRDDEGARLAQEQRQRRRNEERDAAESTPPATPAPVESTPSAPEASLDYAALSETSRRVGPTAVTEPPPASETTSTSEGFLARLRNAWHGLWN